MRLPGFSLSISIAAGLIIFLILGCNTMLFSGEPAIEYKQSLKAGFSKVNITPPLGTTMTGFGNRDWDHGCEGIHDDLYARALYLTHEGKEILIMGFDLLFFSRDEADRFRGAIGRILDLSPGEIILNTSHNHTGPKVGTWYYTPPEPYYLLQLESAIVKAALEARSSAREVTLWSGINRSEVPMNRRKREVDGKITMRPNPGGVVCNDLPVSLLKDHSGKPVCLLFSVSCHPSTIKGDDRAYQISADYPGAAMNKIDSYLETGGSLFLQGAAGDSKPSVIGEGESNWRSGTWDDVMKAGTLLANEVIQTVENHLIPVEPDLCTFEIEIKLPLASPLSRPEYESIRNNPETGKVRRLWAEEQILLLDRGYKLATSVPVSVHGVKLGKGLRLIGVEGEIVAGIGNLIENFYSDGVTFPLGYTNGAQLYITTSKMLDEGGYEVDSYWEYRHPAPLERGIEKKIIQALYCLKENGIH